MKQVPLSLMTLTEFKASLSILFAFIIHVLGNIIQARDVVQAGLPQGNFHDYSLEKLRPEVHDFLTLKRGQSDGCESECSSLEGALSCTSGGCVCPVVNKA